MSYFCSTTNERGEATEGYDPTKDIEWLLEEINLYVVVAFLICLVKSQPSDTSTFARGPILQVDLRQPLGQISSHDTKSYARRTVSIPYFTKEALWLRHNDANRHESARQAWILR
jgi:hypothetical protein